MDKVVNRAKEYWEDNFIRFLLDGKREITNEEIEIRKQNLNMEWLVGPFLVAMIAPDYSSISYQDKDEMLSLYECYVRKLLLKERAYCITNSYNNIVVLMAFDGHETILDKINSIFIEIRKKIIRKYGNEVFVGIGGIVNSYKEISISTSDAQAMLGYKYQYAEEGVINISHLVQVQYNISRGNGIEFDRVIGCFLDGNLGKMEVRLNELVEGVRHRKNVSMTSIRRSLVEVTVQILHIASNANVDVEKVLDARDPYRWIMEQNHTEIIIEWIMEISSELLQLINTRKENEEKGVIQLAKQYIEENLSSYNLSLQQVSEAVNLSGSYCSQLFKKEVGMGISAYINFRRNKRAQTLLVETDISSVEISKLVGYSSAGYFGQIFKKTFGMTPNEYRRKFSKDMEINRNIS